MKISRDSIDLNFMKQIFQESLEIDVSNLELDSEFESVEHWDSLGHVRIVSELEEQLNLEFDIEDIVGQDTVQKLIDMVLKKLPE